MISTGTVPNSFPTQNLHFIEVEDDNTKVAMFENGEVDAIEPDLQPVFWTPE